MQTQSNSRGIRRLTACGLAIAAVPFFMAWYSAGNFHTPPPNPQDWGESKGVEWTIPRVIAIQLRPGTDGDSASNLFVGLGQKFGAPFLWRMQDAEEGIANVTVPLNMAPSTLLAQLQSDSRVEAADIIHYYRTPESLESEMASSESIAPTTPDPTTSDEDSNRWKPNDPRYKEQWNFQMVKAEEAWEVTKGKGVIVAVIDTGVAYDDTKKGNLARDFKNTRFAPGYDFVNRDNMPNDDQGHGTHVAGTIAESTNNKEGVAGLAFEATIMPIKVLDSRGGGRSDVIAEAIRWAADHKANVINMSLGGPYPDKVMSAACEYAKKKGVAIVCAAGNSGREGVGYPAAYKDCIAVSSVGPKGDLSFYSSWGKQVAIAAPGGDKQVGGDAGGILQNTVMRDPNGTIQDDYFTFQGTSMASPHVAAVAALVASQGVKDPNDILAVMQKSAQKKGPKEKYGAGIVDAAAAVKLAGKVHGDGVARFLMMLGLFAGCFAIGNLRKKAGSNLGYPFWGTAAFAFGLLFPDWLTGYLGMTSAVNLIGHSILIPGGLLVLGAEGKTERRMLGWMALGMTLHLGWEFLRGTSPFGPEIGMWQMLPWAVANVVTGFGILLSGLTTPRD